MGRMSTERYYVYPVGCDFCGKKKQAKRRIFGRHTSICDECVALCVEIIEEESETHKRVERVRRFVRALEETNNVSL